MYSYSLFSNALVFCTSAPQVTITKMTPSTNEITVEAGETGKVEITTEPFQANYPNLSVASSDNDVATATVTGKTVTVTGVASGVSADGEATITVTAGNVTTTFDVVVPYHASDNAET